VKLVLAIGIFGRYQKMPGKEFVFGVWLNSINLIDTICFGQ